MQIQLWSVGKAHESYTAEGISLFTKRLSHYYPTSWRIFPPPKNVATMTAELQKEKEGEILLAALEKDDHLVLLDEKGKIISSEALAGLIQQSADTGKKNIIFLIGGAFGVSAAVFSRAQFRWSLSQLVFPHQLVRLILAEQLYRACTINRNEKYHHS